ncbi:NADH dehydrogenase [ubiquinone] 1 alpha subcomplex subunit 5-like 1, partial [Homarus americanus]
TTGLTGLAVATNPHHTLGVLYGKIMRCLQKMPPDAAYQKAISGGQIEEVIQQAENELTLARKMLEWKPWEPLVQEPTPG